MPRPTSSAPKPKPRCVDLASVFQNSLLEEPLASDAPVAVRRQYQGLVAQAEHACLDCPLIERCLYAAVVEHDVAGYRRRYHTERSGPGSGRRCGSPSPPRTSTPWPGSPAGTGRSTTTRCVRLRHAHPDESLETIARRLGCSLSTIKRHLRRERHNPGVRREEPPRPSLSAVVAAAAAVTGWPRHHLAA